MRVDDLGDHLRGTRMVLTRQMYHLAAIQERRGDGIQRVGCANEQHLTEINRNIQVMVPERMVLFGVQNLQQRGRWISMEVVVSNLVNLIAVGG